MFTISTKAYYIDIIVHFKRLCSRHFVKEMKIRSILLRHNMIFRKTNLKPFLKYIQKVSNHQNGIVVVVFQL